VTEFDEDYFKTVNYLDYLNRGGRYDQLADEVMDQLKTFNLDGGPILDFGCAVGHLLASLTKLGYNDCYGVDISDWALEQAQSKGLNVSKKIHSHSVHGVTFSLDVFEHMTEKELDAIMNQIDTRALVMRVPICANEGEDYVLECSRADPTHIIRWTREQWSAYLVTKGYVPLEINLHTIYNSEGVYSCVAVDPRYVQYNFEENHEQK